jgi:hypothetical protein
MPMLSPERLNRTRFAGPTPRTVPILTLLGLFRERRDGKVDLGGPRPYESRMV